MTGKGMPDQILYVVVIYDMDGEIKISLLALQDGGFPSLKEMRFRR
jgi:hypothetical protein